jgi:multidrug/hemolysin transport system ATP-binding protein
VTGLTKRFGGIAAVDDLSFEVRSGEFFAFLGANGAGKSTTIGCLTTTLPFDHGAITVAGHEVGPDNDSIRRSIGVLFQQSVLDPRLTVRENLASRAGLYGINRVDAASRITRLATQAGLTGFLDQRYGTLSGGQRRRADIARALIHSPAVAFLDEPTSGLDPTSREQIWKTINDLRQEEGVTIFLTTHYLEEADPADQVLVIGKGREVAKGTPIELRERFSTSVLTLVPATGLTNAVTEALERRSLAAQGTPAGLRLEVDGAAQALELLAELTPNLADFEFRHGSMDDVFLALTNDESDTGTQTAASAARATREPKAKARAKPKPGTNPRRPANTRHPGGGTQ